MYESQTLNAFIFDHCNKSMGNAVSAERYPLWKRACPGLNDIGFIRLGMLRCISLVDSGRHFLQAAEEVHEEQCPLSTYFKSLKSPRRVRMLEAVEQQSYDIYSETLSSHGIDYLKSFPELNDYTVLAADGHFIDHACHTEKGRNGKVYAAGFIYTLNLRNGLLRPFSLITNGTRRHQEIPVLRDELKRENRTKNSTQKCLYVYDKAVTDYAFWNNQIEHGNLMISVLKENSVATFVESIHFDTSHELNTGIESYSTYENNGIRFSIVNYRDPETKKLHRFITTLPGSINPGTIAMLYFKRWTIEKAFNNSKSNLKETKAWSSDNNSLKNQMRLTAMSYNLLRTVEELSKIQDPELIHPSDKKYTEDLEKRQQAAKKRGGFVNPLFFNERIARISSYTIRAVQNAIMTGKSLSSFINALVAKLVPRVNQIGEH
ncbi:transposase, IS4 family [Bathymodiolus platifrons methanotrophic gill symbiont]|uniref:transposase n=1 Tax=Bathymodiolus platifrons methanotrophic gill symbiont TaxID=113268 RepID=UPI001B7475C5|nr:transposase [Bathymodiolus platifrons methanotrophic gill symbiont]GFO74954.1 transposase, IS4 family [Bathymodiolus platifrons methanotrophic gill symbiont]GFO75794.1 transposase, IS4 family [Bathymodiolus platifrons methanotrophic gill symbiont]